MSGHWAIWQFTQLEDGAGAMAEAFILARELASRERAFELLREIGARGVVYAVVEMPPDSVCEMGADRELWARLIGPPRGHSRSAELARRPLGGEEA